MLTEVQNLLYREPGLYERVYAPADYRVAEMCEEMFRRFLLRTPASILDIGCGTGREVNALSQLCPDIMGIDYTEAMIAFGKANFPALNLQVADMRTFRASRTFESILCLGWALTYALTNDDIDRTLDTFAAHAKKGTLLVLDLLNGARYLSESGFREQTEFSFESDEGRGTATATYSFERRHQLLVRHRVWHRPGHADIDDFCRYRVFFPAELEHLLNEKGFTVLDMFDNRELLSGDLSGRLLQVAARFEGS